MKLSARESNKALSRNVNAFILRILGLIQFFIVAFLVLAYMDFFRSVIGRGGEVVCYISAFIAGFSVSATSFVFADVLDYLHSIRWNTSGYVSESDEAERKLLLGMANNIYAIARAVTAGQDHTEGQSHDLP